MKEELSQNIGREIDLRTPEDISKLFRNEVIQQSYLTLSTSKCTTYNCKKSSIAPLDEIKRIVEAATACISS